MASVQLVLLFLSPLAVSALECDGNENCIPQDNCPDFKVEKSIWENLKRNTVEWKEGLKELKERVCDKKTKGVCCPSTDKQGKTCRTRRGVEGTCQLEQSCRGTGPPIWGSRESTPCGSLTCCPDWATLDSPVLQILSNDVSSRTVPKVREDALCGLEGSVQFVFGGTEAEEGQFPFMVSLVWTSRRTRKVSSFCGGVLITSKHVLTAAHCFNTVTKKDWQSEAVDVRVGLVDLTQREKDGNSAKIVDVKIHEGFRKSGVGVKDDIAIVTLSQDVDEGTVCLPTGHQHIQNRTAVVAGWGRINQGVSGDTVLKLRYAQLKEIGLEECGEKYDHFLRRSRKKAKLTTDQLCAGDDKADACGGDSGGPLLHLNADYSWMVVGIVSFGPSSCAREVPGVYTKVANYLNWIKENTGIST